MKKQKGFTLIEIIIVVSVLGSLAVLFLPSVFSGNEKAKANAEEVRRCYELQIQALPEFVDCDTVTEPETDGDTGEPVLPPTEPEEPKPEPTPDPEPNEAECKEKINSTTGNFGVTHGFCTASKASTVWTVQHIGTSSQCEDERTNPNTSSLVKSNSCYEFKKQEQQPEPDPEKECNDKGWDWVNGQCYEPKPEKPSESKCKSKIMVSGESSLYHFCHNPNEYNTIWRDISKPYWDIDSCNAARKRASGTVSDQCYNAD